MGDYTCSVTGHSNSVESNSAGRGEFYYFCT